MSGGENQTGVSLIELMITLTLSSLLMLGVTGMFADSVSNSLADTALAQLQDSARIAMDIIKRDIRMAGFQGGVARTQKPVPNSLVDLSSQPPLIAIDSGPNSTTTDLLRINRAYFTNMPDLSEADKSNDVVRVVSFYSENSDGNRLIFDREICYSADDQFLVTDGENLATVTFSEDTDCSSKPYKGNQKVTPVGKTDSDGTKERVDLQQFAMPTNCSAAKEDLPNCPVLYQIGGGGGTEYSIKNRITPEGQLVLATDNLPIPALFFNDDEMVEGVENIQILYGIKENSGNILYSNGCIKAMIDSNNCPLNSKTITHVKISLVVVSGFPVARQNTNQIYPIANMNNAASLLRTNDRRLRRVFTSIVQLRNSG